MTAEVSPFDRIAQEYRTLWDESEVGRLQRDAVWRQLKSLFHAGDSVLDLGCGTGEDALEFGRRGVHVTGIDASPEMVRIARERGVYARMCRIENVRTLNTVFNGAYSSFGPLNCVQDLATLRAPLGSLIAPGGALALCTMSRFCLVETLWFLMRGQPGKAMRRWRGQAESSLGMRVYYPRVREIARAFAPTFELVSNAGIGIFVPPSFVGSLSTRTLRRLDRADRTVAAWPVFRSIADHRMLVFRKR